MKKSYIQNNTVINLKIIEKCKTMYNKQALVAPLPDEYVENFKYERVITKIDELAGI